MSKHTRMFLAALALVIGCVSAWRASAAAEESSAPLAGAAAEWEQDWTWHYPDGQARPAQKPANRVHHALALTRLDAEQDLADVVLVRTKALLDDLAALPGAPDLERQRAAWQALSDEAAKTARQQQAARKAVYLRACALRRGIALSNPLLDFSEILFAKTPGEQLHSYILYAGKAATGQMVAPDSGICALAGFCEGQPRARHLLAGKQVVAGRYAGQTLAGRGIFADPDLDYDGARLVFAWQEQPRPYKYAAEFFNARAPTTENARHIFSAAVEGGEVHQLTDGLQHDYAPCWLPGGRIAFVSERDPGMSRCRFAGMNRAQLDFELERGYLPHAASRIYSMRADGSGVRRHSQQDAAEWTPSVDNDGRLVYGRWDYIDRPINLQSFWTSYPDGRDQRSPHGNYPKSSRNPEGSTYMRAIPGTRGRYVYVSCSHSIYECGSLLHLDLSRPDDGNGAQLREITPDVPYNAGGKSPLYSTPWPLSETYYLVAFRHFRGDGSDRARIVAEAQKRGRPVPPEAAHPEHGRFGLYLLDAFGNRELLYRDPQSDCVKPIPLRPRPRPPILPDLVRDADGSGPAQAATIGVMNVYQTDFAWPKDTKITALRIIQIFQNYGGGDDPPMGFSGMALPRIPLGTVPVYEDGSAYFEAPVNRMIYFQALDENGLAVQSMRSATSVQPGETLTCVGCHEDKWESPALSRSQGPPLAFRRGRPDRITPEACGTEPFTFARHVQPILTAKCAACHVKEGKGPQQLADTSLVTFKGGRHHNGQASAAFSDLRPYAFFYVQSYGTKSNRSVAGQIGARASKLLACLYPAHHDVQLTDRQRRMITLWMDLLSPYYCSIFDRDKQHAGELVYPRYDFDPGNFCGTEGIRVPANVPPRPPMAADGAQVRAAEGTWPGPPLTKEHQR